MADNNNNNNTSSSNPPDRPPSPTEVASPVHPAGCTCGCLHSFPKAAYRNYEGTQVFTGILFLDSSCASFKLNDPNYEDWEEGATLEDLAGHGHVMNEDMAEFVLEMSQYDHPANEDRSDQLNIKTDIPLKDFEDQPQDFVIKPYELELFSTIFPHGTPPAAAGGEQERRRWTIPAIRAGDEVKVMAFKHIAMFGRDANERFRVQVVSVTNTGIVVGISQDSIESPLLRTKQFPVDMSPDPDFDLNEGDLMAFPVTCVYGVIHGENW